MNNMTFKLRKDELHDCMSYVARMRACIYVNLSHVEEMFCMYFGYVCMNNVKHVALRMSWSRVHEGCLSSERQVK